MQVPR